MVKEIPSSTVVNRDEECLKKSLMEVVKSDSSNLCRLCLSKEQKLTRAFSDERGIDDALLKKIFDCTTVKVKLKSIFPSAICAVCDLKLNEFYKFREKCIENDTFLHNLLDDRVALAGVDQSVPIVEEQQNRPPTSKGCGSAEQQAATSTTSIPETQKHNSSEMMAIALNQLSSFGLRPLQDLMLETNGGPLEPATGALLPSSGGNVVSSSSAPSQPHDAPAPPLISSIDFVSQKQRQMEQERTFALATLEMAGLQQAMRNSAEGGGKFKCTVCHRTFRNAYTLRRHMNLHTETNLFPCEYCGKKFNDRSNWKIHQRTHTGDNLYTCLVCLKTFISPSTLKYHRRSHRRLESFDCRLCPGTFSTYDLLEEHARNMHQDMQDLQSEEPLIDAASFVKIELEDGELSSSMAVADVSTTRLPCNADHDDHDNRERRSIDSSSVDEAQLAELYRTQQMLELFEKQFRAGVVTSETEADAEKPADGVAEENVRQEVAVIKREMLREMHQQQDVEVKEEPLDDSFELDPSELLQQAMEETGDANDDSEGGEKQFLSSSSESSSPSAVILFRCDYCMKIFHFLDELNAHMLLHNGAKGKGVENGAVMLGSAATSTTPGGVASTTTITPQSADPMALLALMGASRPIPILPKPVGKESSALRKPKRRRTVPGPTEQPGRSQLETVSGESLAPTTAPPEHPCAKCPKMFRTEELRRVHEATHADDEQAHKVRSCRICNKLFKCELNLLAHMRKHSLAVLQGSPAADGEPAAGEDSSGNDESCSSSSHAGGTNSASLREPTTHHSAARPATDDSDEGETVAQTSDLASSESGTEAAPGVGDSPAAYLSRGTFRKCEICAITFKDSVTLDKHMMCHFERKEAIAFVPQTDRPFQCTECHKSFKRKDYLLIHIRTHTGERRYKCDLCSSAFVHPSNLITHRKLHSSERPYQCTLCGATFKLFAGLKIHRRRCEQKLPKNWPDGVATVDTAAEPVLPTDNVHYPF
ncbi:gastrula zinc finger protein xFG20-1-like isoform X2 [Anopheles stephensi]|uniref:gastrula zinc finger protein xFG20-1-like isoform X2 n=1 Tax=Anopheles stephensi TaxID=30069 RepID=UPI001658AF3E|nr:gastrula zinc finger protein xFG20-1-like isoform X2 [Anopheles stephensi]